MNHIMDSIVVIIVPIIFAYVFYSMFTKSGKGRRLGGVIIDSANEEIIQKFGIVTRSIRAHVIESKTKNLHIGLEISENAALGARFQPIKFSKAEAKTLIKMLNEVVSKT